jgi:prophage regulatory protein
VQFIRIRQVLEMIGVSRTTLWRMVQAGTFPRPVRITERSRGYPRETVEAWMTARTDGAPLAVDTSSPNRERDRSRRVARALTGFRQAG